MADAKPTPFDAATAWLAGVDAPVRETVLRHWNAHQLGEGQDASQLRVHSHTQLALVTKALTEHFPVLLPNFTRTIGEQAPSPEAANLSMFARQLVGDDDTFLRSHTRLRTLMLRGDYSHVVLEAPGFTSRDEVLQYTTRLFGQTSLKVTEHPIGGSYRVVMPIYDFKRAVDVLGKPVGYRALPNRNEEERTALENEYRMLMGLEAKPKERDMEAMIQDVGLKAALSELTKDYRLMFSGNLQDGVYVLPITEPKSLIARGAEALLASGALSPHDAAIITHDHKCELHITPASLLMLEEALYHGITGKSGALPSLGSPEASHAREQYFAAQRLDAMRRDLVTGELARMDTAQRTEIRTLLGGKDAASLLSTSEGPNARLALDVLTRAVESVATRHDNAVETRYDTTALRTAIAKGRALYAEPSFWRTHENSQLASHHNAIRDEHSEALGDLDALLAAQPISQAGLMMLINQPRFAEAIRDTGHFLTILQENNAQGYNNGADQFQQAFHLNKAALKPKSGDAKAASYHLRTDMGKAGFGETAKRNLFMGIKPILSSVDLMFKKPVLVGGAVVGLAAYSAAVPKQYRIATLISNFMHFVMESIGVQHSHDSKAVERMKAFERKAIKEGGGSHFKQGMRLGMASTAGTAIALFVGFNVVEDIVVHLPLAIGGAAVGTVGGATGRKVLAPVLNDIGDIAGRFSPEPVRQSFSHDKALISKALDENWIGRTGRGIKQFTRDVDEFGIVATGHHVIDHTSKNLSAIYNHVMGNAPQQAAAR